MARNDLFRFLDAAFVAVGLLGAALVIWMLISTGDAIPGSHARLATAIMVVAVPIVAYEVWRAVRGNS
jgi:hypothetical protein